MEGGGREGGRAGYTEETVTGRRESYFLFRHLDTDLSE